MVANATDFSTDEKGLRETSKESPGRDSNPRPAAYKAAALPLSYPGAPQTARRTLASPACQHALASGFRLSACQHFSTLRTFGPRSQQVSFKTSSPARTTC